jgi:hypothetical protein
MLRRYYLLVMRTYDYILPGSSSHDAHLAPVLLNTICVFLWSESTLTQSVAVQRHKHQ